MWRLKSLNSPIDLNVTNEVEMAANTAVTTSSIVAVTTSASNIISSNGAALDNPVASTSASDATSSNGGVLNNPVTPTSGASAQRLISSYAAGASAASTANPVSSFVTVNAFGVIMPTPPENAMITQEKGRTFCLRHRCKFLNVLLCAGRRGGSAVRSRRGSSQPASTVS